MSQDTPSPQASSTPETLDGRFELVGAAAPGGRGVVRRGRHLLFGTPVAVFVSSGTPGDDALVQSAQQARAVPLHPHLARVFEVGRDGQRTFVVEEGTDGLRLPEWLRARQPLESALAEAVIEQLRGAVTHMHRHGATHGAVRAEQVVVVDPEAPVVRLTGACTDAVGATVEDDLRALEGIARAVRAVVATPPVVPSPAPTAVAPAVAAVAVPPAPRPPRVVAAAPPPLAVPPVASPPPPPSRRRASPEAERVGWGNALVALFVVGVLAWWANRGCAVRGPAPVSGPSAHRHAVLVPSTSGPPLRPGTTAPPAMPPPAVTTVAPTSTLPSPATTAVASSTVASTTSTTLPIDASIVRGRVPAVDRVMLYTGDSQPFALDLVPGEPAAPLRFIWTRNGRVVASGSSPRWVLRAATPRDRTVGVTVRDGNGVVSGVYSWGVQVREEAFDANANADAVDGETVPPDDGAADAPSTGEPRVPDRPAPPPGVRDRPARAGESDAGPAAVARRGGRDLGPRVVAASPGADGIVAVRQGAHVRYGIEVVNADADDVVWWLDGRRLARGLVARVVADWPIDSFHHLAVEVAGPSGRATATVAWTLHVVAP